MFSLIIAMFTDKHRPCAESQAPHELQLARPNSIISFKSKKTSSASFNGLCVYPGKLMYVSPESQIHLKVCRKDNTLRESSDS